MSDSPKHPPDPASELASDNSAIDPRDFRNALGTFATGVTIVTVRNYMQLLCVGIAQSASGAVEPGDVFARAADFPERQSFCGQRP
jgi:hypothetical protein